MTNPFAYIDAIRKIAPDFLPQDYLQTIQASPLLGTSNSSDLLLGISPSGKVCLSSEEMTKSILLMGSPGVGKTRLNELMLAQIARLPFPHAWVVDAKNEYPSLQGSSSFLQLQVPSMFFENFFRPPPGVPQKMWTFALADVVGHSFAGLVLTKALFIQTLGELYQDRAKESSFPTLREVIEHARGMRSRHFKKDQVLDSLLMRLEFLAKYFENSLDVSKGFLDELLLRNVIFDVSPLPQDILDFFTSWLSHYQFVLRKHHSLVAPEAQLVLFIDEGKQVGDRSRDETLDGGVSTLSALISMARSFRLSFCVSTQEPHRISLAFKSAAMTRIAFNCYSDEDLRAVTNILGLDSEQQRLLRSFGPGQAFIRKGPGQAVPFQAPLLSQGLGRMPQGPEFKSTIRELFSKVQFRIPQSRAFEAVGSSTDPRQPSDSKTALSKEDLLILNGSFLNPTLPQTMLWKTLGIPFGTAHKHKTALIEQGLLWELSETIKAGRGGTAKIAYLLPKGYNAIGQQPRFKMRGGPRHYFWASVIKTHEEKNGAKVEIEKAMGHDGHAVDILSTGSRTRAIEICISTQNLVETVRKLKASSVDEAILAFPTQRSADDAREKIQASGILSIEDLARFSFVPLYTFINPLPFHGDIESNQTENETTTQP